MLKSLFDDFAGNTHKWRNTLALILGTGRRKRPEEPIIAIFEFGSINASGFTDTGAKTQLQFQYRDTVRRHPRRSCIEPGGTWAEDYLTERGLRLPGDPEILSRTLRFHPDARRRGKPFFGPALVCAFTEIEPTVPDDPFFDPSVAAIHRIKGRGHRNKFMLGPSGGRAIMISPWWHVGDTLNVCEGVETALGLYNEGAADPDDCHRPVWALGNAGAIRALPVIARVRQLRIFADNDASGAGMDAAKEAARRWQQAGKQVVVRHLCQEGTDYADRAE